MKNIISLGRPLDQNLVHLALLCGKGATPALLTRTSSLPNRYPTFLLPPDETAAAEQGLVLGKVSVNEKFRRELQYTEVLSTMPLITVEKIADGEPIPFKPGGAGLKLSVSGFILGRLSRRRDSASNERALLPL
jgi:hypothetical protein